MFLIVGAVLLLGIVIYTNSKNLKNLLKASVSGSSEETNEIILAARNMALDNIDNLKDNNIITIKDLIANKYLTGDEINPSTNQKYDEDTRVIILTKNGELEDIFISGDLFRNVLSCKDICYIQDRNYLEFNNDTYRILKIDQEGNVYIYNDDIKKTKKDNIDNTIKNIYNSYNKNSVVNVVSLSEEDILKGNLSIEDNIVVKTNNGYKLYNIDTNSIEDINTKNVYVFPLIVLNKDTTYVLGDGSKFNPFILDE
jgi:hypothetical protein